MLPQTETIIEPVPSVTFATVDCSHCKLFGGNGVVMVMVGIAVNVPKYSDNTTVCDKSGDVGLGDAGTLKARLDGVANRPGPLRLTRFTTKTAGFALVRLTTPLGAETET